MQALVSIGMPVYNESRFLEETIQCFIDQDYRHIELLISDNASSDETASICEKYASQYRWIKYHRFDSNQGPTPNFVNVLERAQGEFFMWASGHDLWDKNFISRCLEQFNQNEKAAIVFGTSRWIDEKGQTFDREFGWSDTRGMGSIERYFTVLWGNMNPFLGMYRRSWLMECPIINTVGADLIILSRLCLKGDFVHAVKTGWSRREYRHEASYAEKMARYKSQDRGFSLPLLARLFPLARLPLELLKGVLQSKLSLMEKFLISVLLVATFPVRYIAGKNR